MEEIYVYCDESYQDLIYKDKEDLPDMYYSFFGSLRISKKYNEEFKIQIMKLRDKYGVKGELKWSTVSSNKYEFYSELVDLFFECDYATFKGIVIDCRLINHKLYNESDPELGYYKYYYMLLNNWLESDVPHRIYMDIRTNKYKNRYREFNRIINTRKKVLSTQPINSKESDILQLLNILLGALAYEYNIGTKKSKAKVELSNKIKSNIRNGFGSSPLSEQKFNVFIPHFRGNR